MCVGLYVRLHLITDIIIFALAPRMLNWFANQAGRHTIVSKFGSHWVPYISDLV